MATEPEPKPKIPVNESSGRGWPDAAVHLGALIISKNLLLPAGALAFLLLCVWRLNSGDLKELLTTIMDRKLFGFGGWVLFISSVFVSIKAFKWQERMFRERIEEIKKMNPPPPQKQLELPEK